MNLFTHVPLSPSPFAPYNTLHALSLSTHYLCPCHTLMTHIGRHLEIIPELSLFQLLTNIWQHALIMPQNNQKNCLLFKEDSMIVVFVRKL